MMNRVSRHIYHFDQNSPERKYSSQITFLFFTHLMKHTVVSSLILETFSHRVLGGIWVSQRMTFVICDDLQFSES